MNASPAAIINTPPSAQNLKLKAGMPSQERPLIYSGACVCFITAAGGNISTAQIIPLSSLSAHPSLITFFPLFIFHPGLGAVVHSSLPPPPRRPVMSQRSEDVCGC